MLDTNHSGSNDHLDPRRRVRGVRRHRAAGTATALRTEGLLAGLRSLLATLIVADIDRGGVFASLFGTLALLDADDQAHIAGYVINKFRGDLGILEPGLEMLQRRTAFGLEEEIEDLAALWLRIIDQQPRRRAGARNHQRHQV